jgi:hypothetical protein
VENKIKNPLIKAILLSKYYFFTGAVRGNRTPDLLKYQSLFTVIFEHLQMPLLCGFSVVLIFCFLNNKGQKRGQNHPG